MKKTLIGIFILLMLLIPSAFSLSAFEIQGENNSKDYIEYEFWIFRTKFENLREEIIENITWYMFDANYFYGIVFIFDYSPLYFDIQRVKFENIETGIPKNLFKGFINENFAIGIVAGWR